MLLLESLLKQVGDESIVTGSVTQTTKDTADLHDDRSTAYNQEDEDSYLLLQALAAARAIHHVQGVEYDETLEINVLTDIKFVVVTVSLPLGRKLFAASCFFIEIYVANPSCQCYPESSALSRTRSWSMGIQSCARR